MVVSLDFGGKNNMFEMVATWRPCIMVVSLDFGGKSNMFQAVAKWRSFMEPCIKSRNSVSQQDICFPKLSGQTSVQGFVRSNPSPVPSDPRPAQEPEESVNIQLRSYRPAIALARGCGK